MSEGPAELLPVLVARLGDGERDYLEGVALAEGVAHVQLVSAPTDASPHVLEISSPGRETLVLHAQPLGARTSAGYPLRLRLPRPVGRNAPPPMRKATVSYVDVDDLPTPAPTRGSSSHSPDLNETQDLAPAPVATMTGRRLAGGKLVIEARVGQGGAGTVFRARHRDLHMPVAVKVMHASYQRDFEFCRRFQDEALSASRLDHPNLTRVLDFGQEPDGLLYLAMEYLDGRTLRDVLDREGKLELSRAMRLMIQVCSGLLHAHARNIVHRDIKPENLVLVKGLDDDGRETEIVKVCDFGIAHAAGASAIFAGTPEYISPEQCRGEEPDAQSDIYACGVVLYELLTGAVPISGSGVQDILERQQTVDPEPPSRHARGLDARVDRLVLKALAKEREVRHLTVRELRAELRALVDDVAILASSAYRGDDAPSGRSLHPIGHSSPEISTLAVSEKEDWIERGPAYLSLMPQSTAPGALAGVAPGSVPPGSTPPGSTPPRAPSSMPAERSDVARVIAPFLRKLAETTDPDRFKAIVAPLDAKIRELIAQGHIATVWRVRSTIEMIASERGSSRAPYATKLLELFVEQTLLLQIAERSLDGIEDKDGLARKLVVRAGVHGAYALYSARLKRAVFEARERFVAILQELGAAAVPMIRAALERLEPRLTLPGAVELAEDLIKAVPNENDDVTGQLLARYAKSTVSSLAHLATTALPNAWGTRARPLLTFLSMHNDDRVAIAAIEGLRRVGAIDEQGVRKLEPLVLGTEASHTPVRIAAAEALASATHAALPAARSVLERALTSAVGTTSEIDDFIVVVARTILAIGGDGGVVAERWRNSTTWLRARLESLLRGQTSASKRAPH